MKANSATTLKDNRGSTARALSLGTCVFLLSMAFVHQSLAAAGASDIDPSRYSIGNIVYPPGVKPAPGTETLQNGEVVTDKTPPAVTIKPKSKGKAKHKSNE